MSLPSKFTSYFSAGRPLAAAVPAGGGTAAAIERYGGGSWDEMSYDRSSWQNLFAHARTNLSAEASLVCLTDVLVTASAGGVRR